jgi:uncharacterized membrane protein HdeD (DUF308 family)
METSYKKKASDFMHWLGIAMIAVYFIMGSLVFFSNTFDQLPVNMRIVFGLFLYAFGFFRLVNWFQKHKDRKMFGKDNFEN